MTEPLPMSVAGRLLARASPECGDDYEARKFFTQELKRLVEEADWIEGDFSHDE